MEKIRRKKCGGRKVGMKLDNVIPFVRDKVCLVTGGGGSIGSELVRHLCRMGAAKVVIVDIYENGAYEVKCELGDCVQVEIASVRDYAKMDYIMSEHMPDLVFHAAAHKHVPFMEDNPEEAVKNNIRGTEIITELSEKYNADNFILISTDKAVEPISIMGASKRVCEMIICDRAKTSKHTKFSAVRFGNVLNSNGSVIPLFKRQLKSGKLTVTDKEVTRFFMSIEQAVLLVLQAVTIACGGEVFVLDMGRSISILDIAENVIRESGKIPYKDVDIEFTGLRHGDKLHEKLFYDWEEISETDIDGVSRVYSSSVDELWDKIEELYQLAAENNRREIKEKMLKITVEKQ